jgi:hypothetical protein
MNAIAMNGIVWTSRLEACWSDGACMRRPEIDTWQLH